MLSSAHQEGVWGLTGDDQARAKGRKTPHGAASPLSEISAVYLSFAFNATRPAPLSPKRSALGVYHSNGERGGGLACAH